MTDAMFLALEAAADARALDVELRNIRAGRIRVCDLIPVLQQVSEISNRLRGRTARLVDQLEADQQ